jgi:hypothetical protein
MTVAAKRFVVTRQGLIEKAEAAAVAAMEAGQYRLSLEALKAART